jgi:hypothetical protein
MSDQGIIKRLQDRTSSVSSEDPVATPSSAGTPSTKAATKRKAKRRATSRGDSSGDEVRKLSLTKGFVLALMVPPDSF